ncbi:hypothetical protein M5K25_016462 [Dendrobium thyrsiflorum]|uniref:Uncharacterized protein n=1 Tax=Dendrobium thyrsiflorum TaxID=117978 RepID=A0ABD0URU8_DENTH
MVQAFLPHALLPPFDFTCSTMSPTTIAASNRSLSDALSLAPALSSSQFSCKFPSLEQAKSGEGSRKKRAVVDVQARAILVVFIRRLIVLRMLAGSSLQASISPDCTPLSPNQMEFGYCFVISSSTKTLVTEGLEPTAIALSTCRGRPNKLPNPCKILREKKCGCNSGKEIQIGNAENLDSFCFYLKPVENLESFCFHLKPAENLDSFCFHLKQAENLDSLLKKTPSEPPKSRDDGRRRQLESLLGATFVIPSQTPPHKILSLSQALPLFLSALEQDKVGSSRTMLVGKARSEYEFIIVLDHLDDQFTIFELIVQDDVSVHLLWRLSSEYVNFVSGSLPKEERFSAEGRAVLCRRKRVLCHHQGVVKKEEERFSAGGRGFSTITKEWDLLQVDESFSSFSYSCYLFLSLDPDDVRSSQTMWTGQNIKIQFLDDSSRKAENLDSFCFYLKPAENLDSFCFHLKPTENLDSFCFHLKQAENNDSLLKKTPSEPPKSRDGVKRMIETQSPTNPSPMIALHM